MPVQADVRQLVSELLATALAGAAMHDCATPDSLTVGTEGLSPLAETVEMLLMRIRRGIRQEQQQANLGPAGAFGKRPMHMDVMHVLAVRHLLPVKHSCFCFCLNDSWALIQTCWH